MFNEKSVLEKTNTEFEVLITSFTNQDASEKLLNLKNKISKNILHIHYGCEYAMVSFFVDGINHGCSSCYERQYNLNNSLLSEKCDDTYTATSSDFLKDYEAINVLIEAIVDENLCKETVEDLTYIVKYRDLSIEKVKVRKLEDCPCCGSLAPDYAWKLDFKEQFFAEDNCYRVKKDVDVEKIKKTLCNRNSGFFQYVYKYYTSCYIPIICSEFNDVVSGKKVRSFGRSFSMSGVESSALLEGLERYSGMLPRKRKSAVRDCYSNIKRDAINPENFILHKRDDIEEFGLTKYDPDAKINWVWAYSWADDKPVLIPEQIAYYDANKATEEKRFVYETSNGVALGGSLQEAVLYGLYELIERDAFLLAWYNRYQPTKISLESINNKKIQETLRLVELNGYKVHIFDITTENRVPAVWVLIENPSKDAKVRSYSAAGAHTNPYKAIEGGLVEAITSMPIYENILTKDVDRAHLLNKDFSQVTMMEDHVLMYSVNESFERLTYLFEDERYKTIEELYPDWEKNIENNSLTHILTGILNRMSGYHKDIYFVDQTNDLIEGLGLYCAKVIVPSMQNMHFGEQFKRLNVDRIRYGAVQAGWRDTPIDEADINDTPHPFP